MCFQKVTVADDYGMGRGVGVCREGDRLHWAQWEMLGTELVW